MEKAITQTEGYIETALQKYNEDITDSTLAEIEVQANELTIIDINDKEGYDRVHKLRMKAVKARTAIGKRYKDLNEEAKKFTNAVRDKKKSIEERLKSAESVLVAKEKVVDNEKERIKNEAAEKKQKRIQERINKIFSIGMTFNGTEYVYQDINVSPVEVTTMSDEEYTEVLDKVADAKYIEAERQATSEQKKKEEEARLAKQKAEQEAEQKRLEEQQERIRKEQEKKEADLKAERDKIEAEKKEADEKRWRFRLSQLKSVTWNGQEAIDSETEEVIVSCDKLIALPEVEFTSLMLTHNRAVSDKEEQDRIKAEKAEKEKAEKIKKETEEKTKREVEEKAEKARVAKLEAELAEKLRPDNEKLLLLADAIDVIKMPELANPQSHDILTKAQGHLQRAIQILRQVNL